MTTKFTKLFTPMKIRGYTLRNRIESAPMAFGLISMVPEAAEKSYRKLESSARGGSAVVCLGEVDVNFSDAIRIPLPYVNFSEKDSPAQKAVAEYATRIHKHGALALAELVHAGAEKVPLNNEQETIGPNEELRTNGVKVRAMTEEDMLRICKDFQTSACFMMRAGFDGILIHGGHGFLFTQFLSPSYNKRTDTYGGSLAQRAKLPLMILKAVREAIGEEKILELRLSAEDGEPGGITAEETGKFAHMLEGIVDMIHISTGLYYKPVESHQFSSMFVPHGVNAHSAAIVKQYTSLPVGVVGGINSPEQAEEILEKGMADYIILGRQSLADPFFARKAQEGKENLIRRCLRCFKCFPGSPEEGYLDLPFDSSQLSKICGQCAINPLANLPFDPFTMKAPEKIKKVLIIGGGPAGMETAIRACDRGHEVTLIEKSSQLGGMLFFADIDIDKPDLRNFKNVLIEEIRQRNISVHLNTEATAETIATSEADVIVLALGSEPSTPPLAGIENAHQSLEAYRDTSIPGENIIMIGGGLIGSEQGLFLQKTGHKVTIIEMLDRVANESYGMYREALIQEMKKEKITLFEKTTCLEIGKDWVIVQRDDGSQKTINGDTVLYALGMHSVNHEALQAAAGKRCVHIVGDALSPAKVDQAISTGYMVGVTI